MTKRPAKAERFCFVDSRCRAPWASCARDAEGRPGSSGRQNGAGFRKGGQKLCALRTRSAVFHPLDICDLGKRAGGCVGNAGIGVNRAVFGQIFGIPREGSRNRVPASFGPCAAGARGCGPCAAGARGCRLRVAGRGAAERRVAGLRGCRPRGGSSHPRDRLETSGKRATGCPYVVLVCANLNKMWCHLWESADGALRDRSHLWTT